jgi:predicted cupin superfamily sugar epimerase
MGACRHIAVPDGSPSPAGITAETLVAQLRLQPHPEGGWFRELHRSTITVQRADGEQRCGLTVIWFLLTATQISRWHRVIGADETWHHAGGAPLELWTLPPEGGVAQQKILGPFGGGNDKTVQPVQVVPAGWWQAARCLGDWSLVNCCVGPGFSFLDFELLDPGDANLPPGIVRELL